MLTGSIVAAVVAAGCVALSLAFVWLLYRVAGVCWRSAPLSRAPIRVLSVRLGPAAKTLPGTAGKSITEGKLP